MELNDPAPDLNIIAPWDMPEGWQQLGECRDADPSLFFSPTYLEKHRIRAERETAAKAICEGCSVQKLCRDFALSTKEPFGIWGGLNEFERRAILAMRAG